MVRWPAAAVDMYRTRAGEQAKNQVPVGRPLSRITDAVGVLLFGAVLLLLWSEASGRRSGDLLVYHLAIPHLVADDVYLQGYPEWPYTYPPGALLLMAPLGLPLPVATALMFISGSAAVWVTVRVTVRASAPGSAWDRRGVVALLSALMLLTWPVMFSLAIGQIAPVVMGLTALAMLGRPSRWSGAWLGAAVGLKLTPAAFWLYGWVTGRRRVVLVSIGTFVLLTAMAAVLMPSSSWWYFGHGGVFRAQQDYQNLSNQAITGVVARMSSDHPLGRSLAIAVSALALLLAVAAARRIHQAGWTAAAVGIVGVWSGVAAPLAWTHAFGWWAQLALAVWLCGRRAADAVVALGVYLGPFFVLSGPLDDFPPFSAAEHLQGATYLIVAVAATIYLLWRVRSPRAPVAEGELVLRGQ